LFAWFARKLSVAATDLLLYENAIAPYRFRVNEFYDM